jgi:hypothetical protein
MPGYRAWGGVIGGELDRLRRRKPCIRPPQPIDEENEKDETRDLVGDDRNARNVWTRPYRWRFRRFVG